MKYILLLPLLLLTFCRLKAQESRPAYDMFTCTAETKNIVNAKAGTEKTIGKQEKNITLYFSYGTGPAHVIVEEEGKEPVRYKAQLSESNHFNHKIRTYKINKKETFEVWYDTYNQSAQVSHQVKNIKYTYFIQSKCFGYAEKYK